MHKFSHALASFPLCQPVVGFSLAGWGVAINQIKVNES